MKITAWNPQIITRNAEPVVQLFEALGFEKRHAQEGIGEFGVKGIRMRDANGFYLDISQSNAGPEQDLMAIRMNVDDFDSAYSLLLSHGFRNFYGDHRTETKTSHSAIMISPSGYVINLIEHIHKEA